jgi:hypothetical protein
MRRLISSLNGTSTRQFQRQWNFYSLPNTEARYFLLFVQIFVRQVGDLLALRLRSLERV